MEDLKIPHDEGFVDDLFKALDSSLAVDEGWRPQPDTSAAQLGGRAFLASAASSASVASPPGWGDKPRVVLALGMRSGIGPGLARQGLEQAEPN